MEQLASPGLTPTSQHAGTTSDNSAAMTAVGSDHIPVSTQRQPTTSAEYQAGTWAPVGSH